MSETAVIRATLAPYCLGGIGLDIGFGGSAITTTAITFDQVRPYTKVGDDRQVLQGDCRDLSMFCDGALDYIYSSHLLEDFYYTEQVAIIREWRRVLTASGVLVTYCPDEKVFSAHCLANGQPYNLAHKECDMSLATFKMRVLDRTGPWEILAECPLVNTYSWYVVTRKA